MENFYYIALKTFGIFVRFLPAPLAMHLGRLLGILVYFFDIKHRSIASANLKVAFAKIKTPAEIKKITKQFFVNYGLNLIEVFRLPLMNRENFDRYIKMEGRENITEALAKKKGVILLAMHFGSWEMASLSSAMMEHPYKVIVNPQKRYSKLDDLLNSYRSCGGNVVLSRGLGTREMIKSLQNNELIGLVADQGGRDGVLVPFFERQASMSSGAIRLGLKFDVPICFSIIVRDKGGANHRLIIHPPLKLINTGNVDQDVAANLNEIVKIMEEYIRKYPAEYMWFYKIWKYSRESNIVILDDGRTGHLRQSQAAAAMIRRTLADSAQQIQSETAVIHIRFKSKFHSSLMAVLSNIVNAFVFQGRLEVLKIFLTPESFKEVVSLKADYIVSCGSSTAGLNYLLSDDQKAKSVAIQRPGILGTQKFDLVILPQHDEPKKKPDNVILTKGAINLITPGYLDEQSELLMKHFSHLKFSQRTRIGLLVGGNTEEYVLTEQQIKRVVNQLKEAAEQLNAEILVTTSRRTPACVENFIFRELKKHPRCPLLISPNRQDVPEAVGGILGLSDIIVVSGDSISMVSEAASSGKNTIVFPVAHRDKVLQRVLKHDRFIENLNSQGYIVSVQAKEIAQTVYAMARNKIKTNRLNDSDTVLEAARYLI